MEVAAIAEDYVGQAFVAAHCGVDADVGEGCQSTVHGELGAGHVEGTDGRMMADLLVVNRDSFDVGLESLAEDGVEGLLHE